MKTPALAAALAALAFAPLAHAAVFEASGSYVVGSPVAWAVLDACGTGGATDGVDSSCVALPAGLDGLSYVVAASDAAGAIVETAPAFYDADGNFIDIGGASGTVPAGSRFVGITTLGGVQVAWTLAIG